MRRFLAISAGLHLVFLVALVLSGSVASRDPRYPPVYRINLVAAPRAEALRPARPRPRPRTPPPKEKAEPATRPKPEPAILERKKEVVPEEKAPPKPNQPEPEPARKGPETQPEPEPPPVETPTPESGGNEAEMDLTVEGRPFPFPGYLELIVNKIAREWRRTPNREPLRATVYFRVERSGRLGGRPEIAETSGSFLFDQAALRAVEEASPMPPLPDGYTGDYLGVYFDFNEEKR